MSQRLAKWIRQILAPEFAHLHERLDRLSHRLEVRADEALEQLSPNFPALAEGGYREFWQMQSATRAGAATGVAGRPFGIEGWDELIFLHGEPVARMIQRGLEIGPSHAVLEVGVGIGRLARHLAPLCGQFTGADISPNMIADAQRRLGEQASHIRWQALDKAGLGDFPDATFDRVYFQVVLVHLDPEDVFNLIRETARVLKPGGRAWFQAYNRLAPSGWREFVAMSDARWEGKAPSRGRLQMLTAPELRRMVAEAGLVVQESASHLAEGAQSYDTLADESWWKDYRHRLEAELRRKLGNSPAVTQALGHFDANRLPGAPDAEWAHYLIAVAGKPG